MPHYLAVGLGKACEVAAEEMESDSQHVRALAHRLYDGITSRLQGVVVNGPEDLDGKTRYPGNLNLSFAYVEGESLIMGLKVRYSSCNIARGGVFGAEFVWVLLADCC